MGRPRKKDKKVDDNVWTSNSDLFMALAVVFLILFVFTMLKSGVSQVKSAKENAQVNEYLNAQVPDKIVKKTDSQIKKMQLSMDVLKQKKHTLKKTVNTISELVKRLDSERKTMTDVVKTYRKNEAALKESNNRISQQKMDLKSKQSEIAMLKKNLKGKETSQKKETTSLSKEIQKLEQKLKQAKARNQSMKESNSKLSKKMIQKEESIRENKKVMTKFDRELKQSEQETLTMNVKLDDKRKKIEQLKEKIKGKQQKIKAMEKQQRAMTESQKESESASKAMARQIKQSQNQFAAVKASHGSQREKSKAQLKKMGDQLKGIKNDLRQSKAKGIVLEGELAGARSEGENKAKGDAQKMAGLNDKIGKLKGQIGNLNGKMGDLKGGNSDKNEKIAGLSKSLGQLKGELAGQKASGAKEAEASAKKLRKLRAKIDLMKEKITKFKVKYKDKKRKITDLSTQLNRAISSVQGYFKERKQVATNIRDAMKAKGIDVDLNTETGVLTLNMDDVFKFKNNSYIMPERAKEKLRQIIPLYASKLFGNQEQAKKIQSVTITGNASPQFRRKFVDPASDDPEAYGYNLQLSMARAQQIANFIFSSEIQDFPHKQELKQKTRVAARSYLHPVMATATTKKRNTCGPYDCSKSRRVEIQFIFKNESDLEDKFADQERDYHVSR